MECMPVNHVQITNMILLAGWKCKGQNCVLMVPVDTIFRNSVDWAASYGAACIQAWPYYSRAVCGAVVDNCSLGESIS